MKKLMLLAAVAVFSLSNVNAQENVVKVNPLALLGGTDLVSYERAFGEHSSGIVSGAIGGFKLGSVKYKSAGAGLQYRYYFSEVLNGWYGAATVGYQSGKTELETISFFGESTDSEDIKFSSFGGGARAGYQWIWDSGFSLDLNIGAEYKSFNYDFGNDSDAEFESLFKGSGVLPVFGFGLGYAF